MWCSLHKSCKDVVVRAPFTEFDKARYDCWILFLLSFAFRILFLLSHFIFRRKPDAETYNALINAHGRAGQWRWTTNIMEDMLRAVVC